MNNKITVAVLAMALLLLCMSVVPTFAKNFNYPEGQNVTYTSGGEGFIAPPAGSFGIITSLKIVAADVKIGTHGSGDNMFIYVPFMTPSGSVAYIPLAWFTTNPNPDVISWLKNVMSGFPAALAPNNMRHVSDNVLSVERHGNSITVELTAQQTIMGMSSAGPVTLVVPAFTMELNKIGGSVHTETIEELTGFDGASGYTGYIDKVGFNAEGTITCQLWNYINQPMTNCFITMHSISIWVPP